MSLETVAEQESEIASFIVQMLRKYSVYKPESTNHDPENLKESASITFRRLCSKKEDVLENNVKNSRFY